MVGTIGSFPLYSVCEFLSFVLFFGLCVGKANANEIVESLRELGVHLSLQQAERVLKRSVKMLDFFP